MLAARRESLERLDGRRGAAVRAHAPPGHVGGRPARRVRPDGILAHEEESHSPRAPWPAASCWRARMGKLHLPRAARSHRRPPTLLRTLVDGRTVGRPAGRDRPRRHRRGDRRTSCARSAASCRLKVDALTMLTKALRPLPEKWHGLKDPDLQQRRRYLHLIADETPRRYFLARAAVLQDDPRASCDEQGYVEFEGPVLQTRGRRRERAPVHHVPRGARPADEAADLAGAVSQADAGGRRRARVRDRPQLPQRGHRPRPQPGVHDARGLSRVRRLPHDDGAVRDAGRRVRRGGGAALRPRPATPR